MRKAQMKVKSRAKAKSKALRWEKQSSLLEQINFHAAGIDVGSREHYVAVPGERWEVEFLDDGSVEAEVFKSDGTIYDVAALDEILRKHSDA